MPQDDTQKNIQINSETEIHNSTEKESVSADKSSGDIVTDKFDKAFAEASTVIQDYI